jgi:hypothetical protein
MARIMVTLPDNLLEAADKYCEKYDYERTEFIRSSIRQKVYGKPTEPIIPKDILKEAEDKAAHLGPVLVDESFGICPNCFIKKPKPLTLVTYLDNDQVRVNGSFCFDCINKMKGSRAFVGVGVVGESLK